MQHVHLDWKDGNKQKPVEVPRVVKVERTEVYTKDGRFAGYKFTGTLDNGTTKVLRAKATRPYSTLAVWRLTCAQACLDVRSYLTFHNATPKGKRGNQILYTVPITEPPECFGHPAGTAGPGGATVYCDGSCRHPSKEPEAMTKHTPEPWRASGEKVIDAQDREVCYINQSLIRGAEGCAELARLLAAAPEMLAALEKWQALFDDEGQLKEQYQDQVSVALEATEAALKKAKP